MTRKVDGRRQTGNEKDRQRQREKEEERRGKVD